MCKYGLTHSIIYSFLIVENQYFNHLAVSSKDAMGLMQIKLPTANDIVVMAFKKGIITDLYKYLLEKNLGAEKLYKLCNASALGFEYPITQKDLFNPELNIIIGCLFLQILSKESDSNISQMGLRYLHGYFAFDTGKTITSEMLQNSDYVIKLQSIYNIINKEV